jgi:carbonic anhydrase
MPDPSIMLANNQRWAEASVARDPKFFTRLVEQQKPDCLWIGCSDSRVPATQIVDVPPGEIFVHRNVANLVRHDDLNCQSAIQFAVDVLGIQHILVCGHYRCAGVASVIAGEKHGMVDSWLQPLFDLKVSHRELLDAVAGMPDKTRVLSELSVIDQARNVAGTPTVQNAWQRGQNLTIHSWVYDVGDGLLHDLGVSLAADSDCSLEANRAISRITARIESAG